MNWWRQVGQRLVVGLAVSLTACASKHSGDKPKAGKVMDAGSDAGPADASSSPDAAADSGKDFGADASAADSGAADSGTPPPHYQLQMKDNCRLLDLLLADDRSWTLARCDDKLGKLSLADLHFDGSAPSSGKIVTAALAKDYVLYIESWLLYTLRLSDGQTTPIKVGDARNITALTLDKRHALVFSAEDAASNSTAWVDVAGIEQPIDLLTWASGPQYRFEALSEDASTVFFRAFDSGPARNSLRSVKVADGTRTELGQAILSIDAMQYASLDPATGSVTVASLSGTPPRTWQDSGYLPTRIVSFTLDASALVVDAPNDTRLAPLNGGKSVHLADAPSVTSGSRLGPATLFRWCDGTCSDDTRLFSMVPLDGGPAASRSIDDCLGNASPHFSSSGEQALFWNRQSGVVLADARTMAFTVVLKDVDPCKNYDSYGFSNDGSRVFAWGKFGVRLADTKGNLLGSYPTAPAADPVFSPNAERFAVLVGKDLQIIDLTLSQVIYHATLPADLEMYDNYTRGWVDENRFIYDDTKTIFVVQL